MTWRRGGAWFGVALGAWALVRLGFQFSSSSALQPAFWPLAGFVQALVLAWGAWLWPGIALGTCLGMLAQGAPVGLALAVSAINTAGPLAGSFLLQRSGSGFDRRLRGVSDLLRYGAVCVLGVSSGSAVLGGLAFQWLGVGPPRPLLDSMLYGFVGYSLGHLIKGTFLLHCFAGGEPWRLPRSRWGEAWALALLSWLFVVVVFWNEFEPTLHQTPQAYGVFPLLTWVALRLGPAWTSALGLAFSLAVVVASAQGSGPFLVYSDGARLMFVQLYLGVFYGHGLLLAVGHSERARVLAQEAQSKREAESALQLRNDFISIAAHELKTPLTPFKLQVQVLKRALERQGGALPDGSRLLQALAVSEAQVNRLARLVDEMLDVSRITEGKLRLNPEPMDLSLLVREVRERFQQDITQAGSSVHLDLDLECPGVWDRLRLEQVVVNLLSNAIKYGRGHPILVTLNARNGKAVLVVKDQGIGIKPLDQDRLFQRFERASPSAKFGGLGLGLYITRQIVEAHGGTICVDSQEGVGSTFAVELPQVASQLDAEPRSA